MSHCIYCRGLLNKNDPPDDMTQSKEHIIPWALGGSNEFVTWDTMSKVQQRFWA